MGRAEVRLALYAPTGPQGPEQKIPQAKRLTGTDSYLNFSASSTSVRSGVQEQQVDELKSGANNSFIGSDGYAILTFEFEAFPEPKNLKSSEVWQLIRNYGNSTKVADDIGSCEAFVRQNAEILIR